jgi:glutamate-5-semialdehyde dehydrogenase
MDPATYSEDLARRAHEAARQLATASGQKKNDWLLYAAEALEARASEVLEANARDMAGA